MAFVAGCDDDNTSDLQLNGQTWLNTLQLDEYQGVIDNSTKTVVVGVPVDYNTDAMKVTAIEVSDGAEASMKVGDIANFSFPQTIKVTNGDAYLDYTVTVKHDEARITSFKLNNEYTGIIDEENHSIWYVCRRVSILLVLYLRLKQPKEQWFLQLQDKLLILQVQ